MKKFFIKGMAVFLILFLTFATVSCSKEEQDKLLGNTIITVNLRDSNGTPLNAWTVYAFNQFAWRAESTFHAKQSATNIDGVASFSLAATDIDDGQEVYRFVVYYENSRQSYKEVVPVTIRKGENQTVNITIPGTAGNTNNNGGTNSGSTNQNNRGTLVLVNNSRNPYTVTIEGQRYVVEGGQTRTYTGQLKTYTVSWRQNSGYLVYPTTGNTEVTLSTNNNNVTVKFP